MFRNREAAGHELAGKLKKRQFQELLVLAIPRGGVVLGAVLAPELRGELDIVLARKLRAPEQPELAIGAISEAGHLYLNQSAEDTLLFREDYLSQERERQLAEIDRYKRLFRGSRPPALIAGRSVIVTDDGVATGSTLIAGLQTIKAQHPHELIAAVPVIDPEALVEVRHWCDEVVYLHCSELWSIGQFYEDFSPVQDEQALALLRHFAWPKSAEKVRF